MDNKKVKEKEGEEEEAEGTEKVRPSSSFYAVVPAPPSPSSSSKASGPPLSSGSRLLASSLSRPYQQFSRLQASTNLNSPPSNWLLNSLSTEASHLKGFDATPHYTGFPSFRIASDFLQSLNDADVVADAEVVKSLLKLPYAENSHVSLIVHRFGKKTMLLDSFNIHDFLLRSSEADWQWIKKFFYHSIDRKDNKAVISRRNIGQAAIQERNLISKFLYRSLEDGDDGVGDDGVDAGPDKEAAEDGGQNVTPAIKLPATTTATATATASAQRDQQLTADQLLPPLPEPPQEEKVPHPKSSSHEFARIHDWTFEDIRMLIGSDMPIFGDEEHPSVSLRLQDSNKPINILTGMDYWLDNLMCQVPEVLMCYHADGIVQKYELIKTEDLPKQCKFSAKVVCNVAKNILSFIRSNATLEGHTYWLFKGKDDDLVKLYDLTALCDEAKEAMAKDKVGGAGGGDDEDVVPENPFRTAVSMLLYKAARNALQSKKRTEEESTVRQLLQNCLKLLDKDKFPQIATSAHFMLSDIYIPDDVDPAKPKFSDQADSLFSKATDSSTSLSSATSNDDIRHRKPNKQEKVKQVPASAPYKELDLSNLSRPNYFQPPEEFVPPPLPNGVAERCQASLKHVVDGLDMLEVWVQRQEEEEERDRKEQEWRERENPTLVRSNEPIPMPYDDSRAKETPEKSNVPIPMPYVDSRIMENTTVKSNEPIPMPYDDSRLKKKTTVATSSAVLDAIRKCSTPPRTQQRARPRYNSESAAVQVRKPGLQWQSPPKVTLPANDSRSWQNHLRLVLLKKAFLAYVALAEANFVNQLFGSALKCIKRALNCYKSLKLLCRDQEDTSFILSFAFGLAGDAYMSMVKCWKEHALYQEQFNSSSQTDLELAEHVSKNVDEDLRDWLIRVPKDIEDALTNGWNCLRQGVNIVDRNSLKNPATRRDYDSLVGRLGNASNELGVFYLNQAQMLNQDAEPNGTEDETADKDQRADSPLAKLLDKSQSYLEKGIEAFQSVDDMTNFALLKMNLARVFHTKYFCGFSSDGGNALNIAEFDQACECLDEAFAVLGSKKKNPVMWQTLHWEYSGLLLNYGIQLQENTPETKVSINDLERRIIEIYDKGLKHCDLHTAGPRLSGFQQRAASMNKNMASMHHMRLKQAAEAGDDGERNRGHRRHLAELHYEKAAKLLLQVHRTEYILIQVERVGLTYLLFKVEKNRREAAKLLATLFDLLASCHKPLLVCLKETNSVQQEDRERLGSLLLEAVQRNLRMLWAHINKYAKSTKHQWVKDLYGKSLRLNKVQPDLLEQLLPVLESISSRCNTLKHL